MTASRLPIPAREGSQRTRRVRVVLAIAQLSFAAPCVVATPTLAETRSAQSAPATAAATDPARRFEILGGALRPALETFARETDLRLVFEEGLLEGRSTSGVRGTHAPGEALRILLEGTGLTGRVAEAGSVVIEKETSEADDGRIHAAPVTVLGTRRSDVPLSNVPSSITVMDREEVQEEQITAERIEEILARKVPGFNPTNNGVRQIRGRTAQVFLNGVPVNEQLRASSGSDLNLLSPDQLAGVEVSRGANSAYGFGSPGGVIGLQTPRADTTDLKLRTIVRESFNPQHFNGSHQASLYQSASQIVGNFDYHLGGVVRYDGDEYDADGRRALGFDNSALLTNGEEVLTNFDGSFGADFQSAGRLRLTGTFGYVDFLERYVLNPGVYRQSYGYLSEEPDGDRSYRRNHTLDLTYENDNVFGSSVKLEGFASETYTEVYSDWDGFTYRDEQTNENYGARSSVSTPLDRIWDGAALTYGFDFLRAEYFRPYYNDDTATLETYFSPDVTLDSYAPYVQLDVPISHFVISGGVRHEEYRGSVEDIPGVIEGGDIDPFDLTLFNAGAVYFLNEEVELYATFSQGAEITQLGRAARGASSADQVDPQPAKSNQYEAGVRANWERLQGGLAGFYTESDLLSALFCDGINPCTPLREPREFWGIEATADWQISRQWGVGTLVSWQQGNRTIEPGVEQRIGSRDIPPVLLTTYLAYSPLAWWRNRLQLNYRAERDPFDGSTEYGEGRVDDVALLNLSAEFDVGPGELQLGVRNLLNRKYTSIPAEADNADFLWIPEQGTRIALAYSLQW